MTRRRLWTILAFAAVLAACPFTPASAHSVSGVSATNYETTLGSVEPATPGVRVDVVEAGSRLQVINTTGKDLVVEGYTGEPYLRIGPGGVYENLASPATYLNTSRKGSTVPDGVDGTGTPRWHKIQSGTTARWHDHRIHWMGSEDHPLVRRDPTRRHVLTEWTVPMHLGDTDVAVNGTLTWVPGASPVGWLLAALLLFATMGAVALLRPHARRPVVTLGLVALVAVDVAHGAGTALAGADAFTTSVSRLAGSSAVSFAGWALAIASIVLLARRSPAGWATALLSSLMIALAGGITDLADLSRSQIPFEPSAFAARVLVAVTIGLGLAVAVAAGLEVTGGAPRRPTNAS